MQQTTAPNLPSYQAPPLSKKKSQGKEDDLESLMSELDDGTDIKRRASYMDRYAGQQPLCDPTTPMAT